MVPTSMVIPSLMFTVTSTFYFITSSCLVPQDPPTDIRASVISSTSVSLSYSPPLVTYGYIVSYSIFVAKASLSGGNSSLIIANGSGPFIVENLSPYTYYNISIAASTRIGTGPYNTIIIRTFQDSKLNKVHNINFVVILL